MTDEPMERRYLVFVSSTYEDLKPERIRVLEAILERRGFPDGMEIFPAASDEQWEFIKHEISICDFYVLIVAGKYGSVASDGVSYTEKEFNFAFSLKKPILAFLHADPETLPGSHVEHEIGRRRKLKAFRGNVQKSRLVKFYSNPDDLKAKVINALSDAFSRHHIGGWIRVDSRATPETRPPVDDSRVDLTYVGDNVEALTYVTNQIPKLNRIEETFVRWTERHSSLYAGSVFGTFLQALSASRLLYRAVLGPMTDSAVFSTGGLRDVLAERSVAGLPNGETAAKLYRLLHGAALINFTLLYYFQDESRFFRRTPDIEVLFGYGVHEEFGGPDSTVVFRSGDPRLVLEFQKHFDALRNERFSHRLDLFQPGLFCNQPWNNDVLATFSQLPVDEIVRRIRASGTAVARPDNKQAAGLGSAEPSVQYAQGSPQIKICVSALSLFNNTKFREELKRVLACGGHVSLALWAPESSFVRLRAQVIGLDPADAEHEVKMASAVAKHLGEHDNLSIRCCTGPVGSVSVIWIDDLIYFSPYWLGKDIAEGTHFLVMADSATGVEVESQYDQMLATSEVRS